jgi:hypothetical protein
MTAPFTDPFNFSLTEPVIGRIRQAVRRLECGQPTRHLSASRWSDIEQEIAILTTEALCVELGGDATP